MFTVTEVPRASQPTDTPKFPLWLLGTGVFALLGSGALAARLILEMTVWTWEQGPQMVGFKLIHGSGVLLVLFPFLLISWLAVAAAYTLWRLLKRRPLSRISLVAMALSVGLLGLLDRPYGFWQRLFIDRLASGPYAARLFTYDAAIGDLATVKAFLARGVAVDVRANGQTALHGAAVAGQVEVIEYLIAAGADINATDRLGASPLDVAISEKRPEAAAYLADHGAKAVRGPKPSNVAIPDLTRPPARLERSEQK